LLDNPLNDFSSIESSTAEACDRFYRNLSLAVATGQIVMWGRRAVGDEPPAADHETIAPTYLLTRRHHDLLNNELHEEVVEGDEFLAFSREARAHLNAAIRYLDIKVSKAHAELMIASAEHHRSDESSTTATTLKRRTASDKRAGKPIQHHAPTYQSLLDQLFEEHGPLSDDDPEWNANARVVDAVAAAFQKKHPKEKLAGDTWLRDVVRAYVNSHPEQDSRKRRKPG
jgi:hypothetical protein